MQETSSIMINNAVQLLRSGGLVAFPTETIYGLGANACNPAAVRRIFEITGRSTNHLLTLHLFSIDKLNYWARDIPEAAWKLAERFWPGPLTLILSRRHAPLEVTCGQNTVGLRVPDNPIALAMLEAFGGGVAAPPANRFGQVSPTRTRHVRKELNDDPDMIMNGGPCRIGVESTILSMVNNQPVLKRPGAIPLSALQEVIGAEISTLTSVDNICSPAMQKPNYTPLTRFEVWPIDSLKQRGEELAHSGVKTAMIFIGPTNIEDRENSSLVPFVMPVEPANYARRLYAVLHLLDGAGFSVLLAESPPDTEAWQAVNDRLRRACCNHNYVGDNWK